MAKNCVAYGCRNAWKPNQGIQCHRHDVPSIFNLPSYQHHPNPKRRKLERDLKPRESIEKVQLMESSLFSTPLSVDVST
ncbi:hypothetical protein ILUMI_11771 [Ignelater luminosus]|uniref:Uncharacterized protein n=1 Tax=Ignelater luminosus TaxID=2038154 RepID=A0A8K0G7E6_IGNLU|nr:hypothetical protein ILUMI_11771 [Ignelater luminosus]